MRNAVQTVLLGMLVLTLFASLYSIWNQLNTLDRSNKSYLISHTQVSVVIACISILCILIVLYAAIVDNKERSEITRSLLITNEELERRVEDRTQALYASEKKFRALVENNEGIISLMDASFHVFYRSPSSITITGWSDHERQTNQGSDQIHPDDLPALQVSLGEVIRTPGASRQVAFRILHKKGHYIWLEGTLRNMLHDPAIAAIISNFQDVSLRKQAEIKIRDAKVLLTSSIESPKDMIVFSVDRDYRYLYFNTMHAKAINAIYQQDPKPGKDILECITNVDNRNLVRKCFDRALAGESLMMVTPTVNGINYYESRYNPIVNDQQEIIGVTVFSFDITDRIVSEKILRQNESELEAKVMQRTEQLNKSNQEMEAFTYSVSHDLRAPLRGIVGFTSILEDEYTSKMDAEARRLTSIIKKNTLKMGHLIDELLKFSKIDKQQLIKSDTCMMAIVQEIIEGINPKPENVQWDLQKLPNVQGDTNLLRQVWINLITNAVKYSGNIRSPEIDIGHYRKNRESIFFVKDNGVGFDEQYKEKLFKVFQRLHSSRDFEGTGVGLAIVDKIISKHGGKVWAEGAENKGAIFYFSLPEAS